MDESAEGGGRAANLSVCVRFDAEGSGRIIVVVSHGCEVPLETKQIIMRKETAGATDVSPYFIPSWQV